MRYRGSLGVKGLKGQLTPQSRVLIQTLPVLKQVKELSHFLKPVCSIPYLVHPSTRSYPQPNNSIPQSEIIFL